MFRITPNFLSFISLISFFSASFISAEDSLYSYGSNGIAIKARVIPYGECKNLYQDFPHNESQCPLADPKNPTEVAQYSSRDAYKKLFDDNFKGNGIYLVGLLIKNTGDKPLYLTQNSIKLQCFGKQCLLDQAQITTNINTWLIGGFMLPVIGWFLLYSSINLNIEKFLKEYGVPADGLTLEPGKTFETMLFIDNGLSTPSPASFTIDLKIYSQLSWYKTKYIEFQAQIINSNL